MRCAIVLVLALSLSACEALAGGGVPSFFPDDGETGDAAGDAGPAAAPSDDAAAAVDAGKMLEDAATDAAAHDAAPPCTCPSTKQMCKSHCEH